MRRLVLLATITLLTAVTGCARPEGPEEAAAKLTPEQAADARRTIVVWLECEECTNGELEEVVEIGLAAIPTLSAVLQEGPSPASRESVRRGLARSYQQLTDYAANHPQVEVPMDGEEYIATFLGNYVALHQIRAAGALGAIGGPYAKDALERAPQDVREDVRTAVRASLDSIR